VISRTTGAFRAALAQLPADVRRQARNAYRLFRNDPNHASLRFRRVHPNEPIYSVRIGIHWRAVGVWQGDDMLWFWIGSHAEYDQLLARYRRR
jgi:hypothetical protein